MESTEKLPLENTLKSNAKDMEYENLEPGMHIVGLVEIKNCQKRKFQSDETVDAYRFVFRSLENDKAFVNHTVTASLDEKANLYKLLKFMSGGKLPANPEAEPTFHFMENCVGKWFNCMVEHKPWKDSVWVNIVGNMVTPLSPGDLAARNLPNAVNYFNAKNEGVAYPPKATEVQKPLVDTVSDTGKALGLFPEDDDIPF